MALLSVAILVMGSIGADENTTRLEEILKLLETHHDLLWRQRRNLRVEFMGSRVLTDEHGFRRSAEAQVSRNPSFTIVTLGASPTFGYAVEHAQSYPRITESLLREGETDLRVINAGQIGYSSWQGLKLFKSQVERINPDLVSVSYMVNDIDRLRFFFSDGNTDQEAATPSRNVLRASNVLSRVWPSSVFLRGLRRLRGMMAQGGEGRHYELAQVRVTKTQYEKNLRGFVEICRKRGIDLIFITMPFRMPDPVPPPAPGFAGELDRVEKALDHKEFEKALREALAAILRDPHTSRAYYLKGRALEALGEDEAAGAAYRKAIAHLAQDCARDAPRYNAIMRKVAINTDTPLVDAATALKRGSLGGGHFVPLPRDYIHPNPAGHAIIARCLSAAIRRLRAGEKGHFLQPCAESR